MARKFAYDNLVFDGIIAKVHRVGLQMSDGKVVARDYICYPGASIILPVLSDGRIVMIRNFRFAVDQTLYELPAGCLDPGEDPALCAARELAEETGYTAGRIEKLGSFFTGPGVSDEIIHAYLATDLREGRQALETYEEIDLEIMPARQVQEMVADGRICDAKTISALALYWLKSGESDAPG
ncbi:MAG: NUDIX hydrolase [Phycisphaerae bacterium]|jgi:ADP-ribose pyrophosphatase